MEKGNGVMKEQLPEKIMAGSNLPEQVQEGKPAGNQEDPQAFTANISTSTFSTFFTWRGNGIVRFPCFDSRITANSRVFVSISEFNSDARQNRFIGDAYMSVLNVSPFNGGFWIRINVGFSQALNVRLDVLVDPSWI